MKYKLFVLLFALMGRPPRGGRGLKYHTRSADATSVRVAPLAGGVD